MQHLVFGKLLTNFVSVVFQCNYQKNIDLNLVLQTAVPVTLYKHQHLSHLSGLQLGQFKDAFGL